MKSRLLVVLLLLTTFTFANEPDMTQVVAAATVSSKHHKGSSHQDQLMISDNPDAYIFGTITRAQIFTYHKDVVTAIAVQPFQLSQIYEVNLAFCGNEAAMLNGKVGLVVITYRKQMDRTICFDLIDIRPTDNSGTPVIPDNTPGYLRRLLPQAF